ncbi:cytochrome C [Corallococcus aberystwythensis]|uniref:Cytochrome C n=1 Tax=Corallococcus aberystwythensis TaxID=2316722 RepID=A0A3A8Q1L0_9BACT|nr:cytochrome C [Corallococcus aberystwythensis]RKH58722.1 cytochrome C [Corallococcus aberystwythensis]
MGGAVTIWERCTRTSPRLFTAGRASLLATLASLTVACGGPEGAELAPSVELEPAFAVQDQALSDDASLKGGSSGNGSSAPVPLALEVDNGEGVPLKVKAGQRFWVNQIDLRASIFASKDEGVDGLRQNSDFLAIGWGGVRLADQEFVGLSNPDGTFTRRRFYRDAAWMKATSLFTVEPVDARGVLTGAPVLLNIGSDDTRRTERDDFFIRRMRAIQWTRDCRSLTDCSGAKAYEEEALVELRNAYEHAKKQTLTFTSRTVGLRLRWSLRPFAPYYIPVTQVSKPAYSYGFGIDIKPVTAPRKDGTYAPGSDVTFQMTLKDGQGKRLHPAGSLPTYNEVAPPGAPGNPAGIQYYQAFFNPTTTYYRRKHQERMMMTQLIGPAQDIQPIRSIVDLEAFLDDSQDVQTIATPARDGVYAQFMTFPPANKLFGGAFFPNDGRWDAPVSDTWTYHLPADAKPGTYLVTAKARRVYLGEDRPASRTIEIQVGTKTHTSAVLTTGPCNTCHSKGGELGEVLHANDNRAACASCHAPLGFELEGPIFVRTHFIHSRSNRFDAPLEKCSSCHLKQETTQRTSKAACLSCHKSYPDSHVEKFGPIESMYVGGGRESFQQCTGSCHKTHPGAGF